MSVSRLVFALVLILIGAYTMLVGIRDGLVRGHIRSRWHRDERELTGAVALWAGVTTTIVGALVIAVTLWLVLRRT